MSSEPLRVIIEDANCGTLPEYAITVFVTVISGVLVYALSELLKEIWLFPLREYKKQKQRIAYLLAFYGVAISSPCGHDYISELHTEANEQIRLAGAELSAYAQTLFWFKPGIPSKEALAKAADAMNRLSSQIVHVDHDRKREITIDNISCARAIKAALHIYQVKEVTTK